MRSPDRIEPLELVPGASLDAFALGQTLFSLLNLIRSDRHRYPTLNFAWDERSASTSPIHLTLSQPPVHLLFDGPSQRLSRIELHSSPARWIHYRGQSLLGSPNADDPQQVVKTVRRVMGPTYSSGGGAADVLSYPGVAFEVVANAQGVSELARVVLTPLPQPPNVAADQAWLHPILPDSPAIAHGDIKEVEIKLDASQKPTSMELHLHLPPAATPRPPIKLALGVTTNEDLLCDLGSPIRSFWKEDDRMSIHTSPSAVDPSLLPNGYFHSYPHLGLTLLLHPTRHTLLKLILHSNLPGEVNFGRTARCNWSIVASSGGKRSSLDRFELVAQLIRGDAAAAVQRPHHLAVGNGLLNGSDSDSGSRAQSVDSARSGSSGGKRSRKSPGPQPPAPPPQVVVLAEGQTDFERPMVLDRAADGGDGLDRPTEIWGFDGVAMEVTGKGEVETVWLF